MDFTYIWNKLCLLWKKGLVFIVFAFFTSISSFGQKYQEVNLPNSDNHKLHYGFLIGGHSANYKIKYSPAFILDDTIHSVKPMNRGGFSLGLLVNKRLGEYFDLRFLPTAGFYDYTLQYRGKVKDIEKTKEITYAEFPVLLKYKSERRKNFRMYLVGGLKPAFEVTERKDEEQEQLNISNFNLSLDYGFGVDIYYPMFKFSPEIRFSHGLLDMRAPSNSPYNRPLNSLKTHTVSLFLIFGS